MPVIGFMSTLSPENISKQTAVHAKRRLSPELRGMAHLPRDGKGRKKDAGGRVAYNGHYDAAKGPPADQLLVTRSGSSLLKLARTISSSARLFVSGRSRLGSKARIRQHPSGDAAGVTFCSETDWARLCYKLTKVKIKNAARRCGCGEGCAS
jgi:hypothetical protein